MCYNIWRESYMYISLSWVFIAHCRNVRGPGGVSYID